MANTIFDKEIIEKETFSLSGSPYHIRKSITIIKTGVLTIEPGVILKMNPKVKISVEGVMIANGNLNNRITFTKYNDSNGNLNTGSLKLVNGLEYRQGNLYIKYLLKWRPICSQNREWSPTDIVVACKEMGFLYGNFSLESRAENDTTHMLLMAPGCTGKESSFLQCPGLKNASIGSAVCNLQELVGLHCWGADPAMFADNWGGLTFYNSSMSEHVLFTQNTRFNVSQSQLNYVDILYAGVNQTNHRVSALSSSPYPPMLSNIRLAFNAYDAINFTDIRGPAIITNTVIENNFGHGINITSSIGYVHLTNVTSRSNTGAGGYIQITSKHWAEETPELVDLSKSICGQSIITSSPMFPFFLITEHLVPNYNGEGSCFMPISTDKPNQIISIKLVEAIRDPSAEAIITITDESTSKILGIWNFTNSNKLSRYSIRDKLYYGPLYQGFSSTSGSIKVTYDWKKDRSQQYCPSLRQCFRGIIQISAGLTTNPEVVINDSNFHSNVQHGLRIENLGLYAKILNSKFSDNEYGSGLSIVNGSSDILVHNCTFENNDRAGLNISSAGGIRIVNSSLFINNQGHGLDIWNPTWLMTRFNENPIENVVFLSTFQNNLWNGIRFYNSSNFMNILVNFSRFIDNQKNGIEMISAIDNTNNLLTNFTVGFSSFVNNNWHGVMISPIGQMSGSIFNSTFTSHSNGGAIYIDNGINFDEQRLIYRHLPVSYSVKFNDFYQNTGPFVVLVRLTQNGFKQNCSIILNKFFNNKISTFSKFLNPRSFAPAVIVLGSSNIKFSRNFIRNPDSKLEISTQLIASEKTIDATINYWGNTIDLKLINWEQVHAFIFDRIFDHESRYSLAKINYYPILKEPYLLSNVFSNNDPVFRHQFRTGSSLEIGGAIDVNIEQRIQLVKNSLPYRVTRDIFVPQGVSVIIDPGVHLEFENSIGLFVQGSVTMKGTNDNYIRMFMRNPSEIKSISSFVQVISQTQLDLSGNNLTLINSTLIGKDATTLQGILRVNLKGTWGVVCDNKFDLIAARIACSELGLVAHPMDWEISQSDKIGNVFNDTIVMSTVRCQNWMTSFDQCEFDGPSDHNCSVGIINVRCHKPGWAGVQISLTNEVSTLSKLSIVEAGLMDYYFYQYKPALQIDFNKHIIEDLLISRSLYDGLLIHYNDMLSFSKITNLTSINNLGSGIAIRTPWVTLEKCKFLNNKLSGFKFDPSFSEEELFDFRSAMLKTLNLTTNPQEKVTRLGIHTTGIEILTMSTGHTFQQDTYWYELKATDPNNQQQLLLTLIDFNPDVGVENITIFDNSYDIVIDQLSKSNANQGSISSITWQIPNDLTRFPVLSNSQYLTIRVVINGTRSGRLAFLVQPASFIDLWNSNRLPRDSTTANGMMYYFPSNMSLTNSELSHNAVGATVTHYNTGTDSQNRSFTLRQSRLYINIANVRFHNNSQMGLHIPSVSPYASDFYFPTYGDGRNIESIARVSRIYYSITNCSFTSNANIILAEHNHVPFSNNVWQYLVTNNQFKSNNGGINIQIPFVSTRFDWRYIANIDHSIQFSSNEFTDNKNFQYIIDGYYMIFNVTKNRFTNNVCQKQGLISIQGMEKLFNISWNVMENNRDCDYIIEVISNSQSELANPIIGYIGYNRIINNFCSDKSYSNYYVITCYTIGVFGNQNVTVRRNILDNKNRFKYELVAGVVTNQLNTRFDAMENYWGTIDVKSIRLLIFDINNWNNYAEVNFERFLLVSDFGAYLFYNGKIDIITVDINARLGGQIGQNLFLPYRQQPYIVQSDLTVLPGVELRIDSGVTLEFMPNIGILVLGRLIARGVIHRPIIMRPFQPGAGTQNPRVRRAATALDPSKLIRLIGGSEIDEGFVQFFNQSAQRWDYMCDDQFSKQVGSVLCRQMGLRAFNPRIRRSYLVDFQLYGYDNPFIVKYIWNIRYACRGFESTIEDCIRRFNYNSFQCLRRREFVFLKCDKDFLEKNESFWGNIRIVLPGLEQMGKVDQSDRSFLEHINITKAGILHGELVSAIQTTHAYPLIKFVNIDKCAWNGIDIIAPRIFVQIANSTFTDNIGYGVAITLLNGDSSDPTSTTKQLIPMRLSPLPSSVLGLINMCDISKDMFINDRLIVYYRYSYRTIACTKLIRSQVPNKRIAVKFLQLNLFFDPFTKNTIEIFNGANFNSTELLTIVESTPRVGGEVNGFLVNFTLPPFVTQFGYDILGLHLFASPASEDYGFIIELLTVPVSPDINFPDVNQYTLHRISESNFYKNQGGAIRIAAVGETNPVIDVYYNRFIDNGGKPMLNITADPVALIRLQNCKEVNIANNYFSLNRGGSELYLYSSNINQAIRANFTNNVIINTTVASCLKIIGNYLSSLRVERNFIVNNDCENRDVIKIEDVIMSPFAYNYLNNNRGSVMVNISGEEDISIRSQFLWNGFYDNLSINYTRSTTIFCANSKNTFSNNYFRNLRNDFELVTGNRSIMKEAPINPGNTCPLQWECQYGWVVMLERNSCVCYRPDTIIATQNWWGETPIFFTRGRIWDKTDDQYLIPVDYSKFYTTNETVLGGGIYCPPTWTFYDKNCYFYFGAPVDYGEARAFCQSNIDAVLADSRNIIEWMGTFIAKSQNNYYWINRDSWNTRAWVHSYIPLAGRCPAIRYNWLEGFQCDQKVQFICQKSPYGAYKRIQMEILIALIVIVIILFLILLLLFIFWHRNSVRRHQAFLVRCTDLKHYYEKQNAGFYEPGVDFEWMKDNKSNIESSRASSSILYSKIPPASGTVTTALSSSGRSRYDDDVMKMRRNTLTDTKEVISRPKSSIDYSDEQSTPLREIEVPTQMINPKNKKARYDPRGKPKTATLDSKFSGASTEALYVNTTPGSQLKLSQPDVPKLFRPDSRSTLHLPTNQYDDDPSRSCTMVDPLLDPSVMSRNKPIMTRIMPEPPQSINDSFNSSADSRARDTSALLPQSQKRNPDRIRPPHSRLSSKSTSKSQFVSSESEI